MYRDGVLNLYGSDYDKALQLAEALKQSATCSTACHTRTFPATSIWCPTGRINGFAIAAPSPASYNNLKLLPNLRRLWKSGYIVLKSWDLVYMVTLYWRKFRIDTPFISGILSPEYTTDFFPTNSGKTFSKLFRPFIKSG